MTVIISMFACTQQPKKVVTSDAVEDSMSIVIIDANSGERQKSSVSLDDMKKYLEEHQQNKEENIRKGANHFDPTNVQLYWIKNYNTESMFSHIQDGWTGINYHAHCMYGTFWEGKVYIPDSTNGEIYFYIEDLTQDVTETDRWNDVALYREFDSIEEALKMAACTEDKKVLNTIKTDMKKSGYLKSDKMTPLEIKEALQKYAQCKKGILYKSNDVTI